MLFPARFLWCLAGLAGAIAPVATPAQNRADTSITAVDLRRHVDVLASDAFGGRAPGTEGERLTTDYLIGELSRRGVEPAAAPGEWRQRVSLVERGVARADVRWQAGNGAITLPDDALVLVGRDAHAVIADAPLVFAGHGAVMPDRGIDQLAGADLHGAVALILFNGPQIEDFPTFAERVRMVSRAGAAAVIGIMEPGFPMARVREAAAGTVEIVDPDVAPLYGAMSWEGAAALVRAAGRDLEGLLNEQPGSSFRSVMLAVRARITADANSRRFESSNIVGRIRGTGGGNEAVLLLAHWDHLGLCRPTGAPDRLCNGAVDNASGVATLIEAADRLARGPRPVRDILILATTAEEDGLLGAEYFARHPTLPVGGIVAALNLDTAAIAPAGTPVAVIGGTPAMERVIGRVAVDLGRRLDFDREADVMVERQDGFALSRHGIPTAMAGGNLSDMARLSAFLATTYHSPADQPSARIDYSGAAEDANLLVALARAFADPAQYPAPASAPAGNGAS
jgi:Peptidase family M28